MTKNPPSWRNSSTWLVAALLAAGAAAACGGGTQQAESPAAEGTEEPAAEASVPAPPEGVLASSPEVPFDQMPPPDQMKYMKQTVAPHMAKVFQEYAPEDYADFDCTTCHGPGAKNGDFEMPTDALPALDEDEMNEHPEFTQFMKERVVPEMATLLGERPFDMETGEGFGCYDCHMKKE